MRKQDRYDSLIQYYTEKYSGFDWLEIKAVIKAESNFTPRARSSANACGLMQILPGTFYDLWDCSRADVGAIFDPEQSIRVGIKYLWLLYGKYQEIPDEEERLRFALAAYNAGRGNINEMLEYARASEGIDSSYAIWKRNGSTRGKWQTWAYSKRFLSAVTGKHAKETLPYVARIERNYRKYKEIVNA